MADDSDAEEETLQVVAAQNDAEKKEEKEEDHTLANDAVVNKYQEAARIAQSVLVDVVAMCVVGARVVDICRFGDTQIESRAAQVYNKKKDGKIPDKGIAFPVCVSVNECVCHSSPLESELVPPLALGDLVKIDMGAHVDGHIAVVAHTVRVGVAGPLTEPLEGAIADAMHAAWAAAEVATKLIKPGNTNAMVTAAMKQIAEAYGVNAIQGTLMHQMKRYVIDGSKMVLLREEGTDKIEGCTFEPYEVYAIDVAMSTGEGKPREENTLRTTVRPLATTTRPHPSCVFSVGVQARGGAAVRSEDQGVAFVLQRGEQKVPHAAVLSAELRGRARGQGGRARMPDARPAAALLGAARAPRGQDRPRQVHSAGAAQRNTQDHRTRAARGIRHLQVAAGGPAGAPRCFLRQEEEKEEGCQEGGS